MTPLLAELVSLTGLVQVAPVMHFAVRRCHELAGTQRVSVGQRLGHRVGSSNQMQP